MSALPERSEPMVWPTGILPRLPDGTVDVAAYCRQLDEFFNQGLVPVDERREAS